MNIIIAFSFNFYKILLQIEFLFCLVQKNEKKIIKNIHVKFFFFVVIYIFAFFQIFFLFSFINKVLLSLFMAYLYDELKDRIMVKHISTLLL